MHSVNIQLFKLLDTLKAKLFLPVDIAILVYFRILAASLISGELINSIFLGDIEKYQAADFHFSYQFFSWLNPWTTAEGMYIHYCVTIVAGFMVAAGMYYRYASVVFFIGFSSLFLMEETEYINHTYLYCLISFWMMFMPLNRAFSYDAFRDPKIQTAYAPAWCYYLLLFQMSIVYFYAGVAKLNPDWLQGVPMHMVLPYKADTFLIGPLLALPGAHLVFSYMGLAFDLLIVPILLLKRTRIYGFIFALIFHLSNVLIFGLATFPWFSIMMTSLFFHPSWPRKVPFFNKHLPPITQKLKTISYSIRAKKVVVYGLILYALIQVFVPLRHWLYPGNVNWTEEGHYFSWRMMLRGKTGSIMYQVTLPESDSTFSERPMLHINYDQYSDLIGKPELIIQYAHFLAKKYQHLSNVPLQVTATTSVSLNGRPGQPIVDPSVNLVAKKRGLQHYEWIVPLRTSLKELEK